MIAAAIDWTTVIVAIVSGFFSMLSALFALIIRREIRTPSGKSLGEVAEYAHDTAIANNLLLSEKNGPTKPADPAALKEQGATPPRVPVDAPAAPPAGGA
jgi:hypothetical protein